MSLHEIKRFVGEKSVFSSYVFILGKYKSNAYTQHKVGIQPVG